MTDPAHSKSEYKRRATLGDPDATPPADLPPLPTATLWASAPLSETGRGGSGHPLFTAEDMRAYGQECALAAVAAERERCAALCMALSVKFITRRTTPLWEGYAHGAERCAEAIREG